MTEYEVCQQNTMACEQEIAKGIIGQKDVIRQVMLALLAGGNVLLEGMPGLGKTMLVRTISQVCDLSFQRIQFTPDLMPSDVTGTNIIVKEEQKSAFRFEKGPIFANLVLADEINRATPKTQSALLEAMQEHTVTIGTTSHQLPEPFLVLATQNPIENEGTYPLPEAQLDRFLFKVLVKFPDRQELREIVELTEETIRQRSQRSWTGKACLQRAHALHRFRLRMPSWIIFWIWLWQLMQTIRISGRGQARVRHRH